MPISKPPIPTPALSQATETAALPGGGGIVHAGSGMDMSLTGLFMQADLVVQSVILLLIAASFWSWKIIIDKNLRLRRIKASTEKFEDDMWASDSLDGQYERVKFDATHPLARMFVAGMTELLRLRQPTPTTIGTPTQRHTSKEEVVERAISAMDRVRNKETAALESELGFLATVGSTAPFVGLFGTVWGIMNSFQSIALSKNTTLAVVAPGIAEALFATAIGLFAAIPAVIFYNKLANATASLTDRFDAFTDEFGAVLARKLD